MFEAQAFSSGLVQVRMLNASKTSRKLTEDENLNQRKEEGEGCHGRSPNIIRGCQRPLCSSCQTIVNIFEALKLKSSVKLQPKVTSCIGSVTLPFLGGRRPRRHLPRLVIRRTLYVLLFDFAKFNARLVLSCQMNLSRFNVTVIGISACRCGVLKTDDSEKLKVDAGMEAYESLASAMISTGDEPTPKDRRQLAEKSSSRVRRSTRSVSQVIEDDISMMMRRRAIRGYGLVSAKHNAQVLQQDPYLDTTLSELWAWIHRLWEGFAPLPQVLDGILTVPTTWEKDGRLSRAACWLVFTRQYPRALELLMRSDDEMHNLMSAPLAALIPSAGGTPSNELRDYTERLLVSKDWFKVLEEELLSLRERLAIAFQFSEDKALSSYLRRTIDRACTRGNIEGLIIAGESKV
ncbi:hypothetical protein K503DRAFT_779882 [Rhizopogon vinicolor AM-OR11-026]|uniref:Uncharacterized protein n=1 Tax=Rhizopogon vinicolor AM-OR11-026 TaxID=1314800 RepID=A0A1B7NC66_9AGAM|nr:hypothetical protein K503DRAFT_779882 [Rhizopogon vinicolor AM-OR11-026]